MIIYKATNTVNRHSYIGQTGGSLNKRINDHHKQGFYFHNALKKYGQDNFTWEVLCHCDTKEELDEMEYHYIMQYDTFNNGYNLTLGGDGVHGTERPDLIKMNQSNTGKSYEEIYGIEKAREIKQKMSDARKGKDNKMYGRTHSSKTINKMSRIKQRYTYSFVSPDDETYNPTHLKTFCEEQNLPFSSIKYMLRNSGYYKGWTGKRETL